MGLLILVGDMDALLLDRSWRGREASLASARGIQSATGAEVADKCSAGEDVSGRSGDKWVCPFEGYGIIFIAIEF